MDKKFILAALNILDAAGECENGDDVVDVLTNADNHPDFDWAGLLAARQALAEEIAADEEAEPTPDDDSDRFPHGEFDLPGA